MGCYTRKTKLDKYSTIKQRRGKIVDMMFIKGLIYVKKCGCNKAKWLYDDQIRFIIENRGQKYYEENQLQGC